MIVDELILKIQGDVTDINKKLGDIEKKSGEAGEKAGKSFFDRFKKPVITGYKTTADGLGTEPVFAKTGEKAGGLFSSGFGKAFAAIGGAVIVKKLTDVFKNAIDVAGRTEAALKGVESSARAFGQSTDSAVQAAKELTEDGFLNLEQAAIAVKNLMSTGLNVDQTKKFITASKDITAFQNTIGDASQAVTDLSTGLLRGSALVIDNASPSLRKLSGEYQTVLREQGKAAAAQLAYNEVIKQGAQFSGDAARSLEGYRGAAKRLEIAQQELNTALGSQLRELVSPLISAFAGAVKAITGFFTGLSGSSQKIIILTPLIALFGATLLKLIPILIASKAAILALAGPIGLAIAGIVALTAVIVSYNEAIRGGKGGQLAKDIEAIQKSASKQFDKQKQINAELEKHDSITQQITRSVLAQNLGYDRQRALIKAIGNAEGETAEQKKAALQETLAVQNALFQVEIKNAAKLGERTRRETNPLQKKSLEESLEKKGAQLTLRGLQIGGTQNAINEIDKLISKSNNLGDSLDNVNKKGKIEIIPFGFVEARDELKQLADDYAAFVKSKENKEKELLAQVRAFHEIDNHRALNDVEKKQLKEIEGLYKISRTQRELEEEDFRFRDYQIRIRLKQSYAEFIEDTREAEILGIRSEHSERLADLKRELQAREIGEKEFQRKKEKLDNAARDKKIKADLEAAKRQLDFIEQGSKGLSGLIKGGGFGASLGGAGGIAHGIGGLAGSPVLGGVGVIAGAVGGIATVFEDLFSSNDEEERRRDQERREAEERRHQEVIELSKQQAEYLRKQLELQQQSNNLNDLATDQQMRLNDLLAEQKILESQKQLIAGTVTREQFDTQVKAAEDLAAQQNIGVLQNAISTNIGQAQTSLSSTGQTILAGQVQTTASAQNVSGLISQIQGFLVGNDQLSFLLNDYITGKIDFINFRAKYTNMRNNLSPDLRKAIDSFISSESKSFLNERIIKKIYSNGDVRLQDVFGGIIADKTNPEVAANLIKQIQGQQSSARIERTASFLNPEIAEVSGGLENALKELGGTFDDISQMTELQQQQLDAQLSIKTNTEKTATALELRQARERSFIDIGAGSIRSLGQSIQTLDVGIPQSLGNAIVIADATKSVQERMADSSEISSRLLYDIRRILLDMLGIMDSDAQTVGKITLEEFTALQAEAYRRSL